MTKEQKKKEKEDCALFGKGGQSLRYIVLIETRNESFEIIKPSAMISLSFAG